MIRKSRFKASGRNDIWFVGACVVGLVAWGIASHADAQDVSANAAVSSDYVFRGVSQTEEEAAVSAGVDLTNGSFYAGAWASNVAFPGDPDTGAEIDLYAGIRPEFAGWTWDVGAVGYFYTGQPDGADYDYVELKAGASRAVGPVTVGAVVFWSPDYFGAAEDEATYVEGNAAFEATGKWTISGALGRQYLSSDFDYTTWNVGAAYALTDALTLDLRYHDTDEHDFGQIYESRAVATLKAAF